MDNLTEFLKLYFKVEESDVKNISYLFDIEYLPQNEFYIKEGRICNKFSFIKSGAIRLYSYANEKEITQWIATDNHFVADLNSFTFQSPCRWHYKL